MAIKKNRHSNLVLSYKNKEYHFNVQYIKRMTLSIHLERDSRLVVKSPYHIPEQVVIDFINKKFDWIERCVNKLSSNILINTDYQHADDYYFLGKKYKINKIKSSSNKVKIDNNQLCVEYKSTDFISSSVNNYTKKQAIDFFQLRVDYWINMLDIYKFNPKLIKVRWMKTRWGSCSSISTLTFNIKLIHVPIQYIDYVIIHELCHLKHFNHSKKFYDLQKKILPNYPELKDELNKYVFI